MGDNSGLARRTRRGCRKDLPDHAVSAETSTTMGSTRVSATGSLSRLNLSRVVPFTVGGHGCFPFWRMKPSGQFPAVPCVQWCGPADDPQLAIQDQAGDDF